jgi:hypothetical protein
MVLFVCVKVFLKNVLKFLEKSLNFEKSLKFQKFESEFEKILKKKRKNPKTPTLSRPLFLLYTAQLAA